MMTTWRRGALAWIAAGALALGALAGCEVLTAVDLDELSQDAGGAGGATAGTGGSPAGTGGADGGDGG
jgi:hypothetical protein